MYRGSFNTDVVTHRADITCNTFSKLMNSAERPCLIHVGLISQTWILTKIFFFTELLVKYNYS